MFDIKNLPVSPEQARAARAYFGWSQTKAIAESGLRADKLKRFEAGVGRGGSYIPDNKFLEDLRAFYEREGYPFDDAVKPGANAKQGGLVFPAGVVTGADPAETNTPTRRPVPATIHHMRIAITDEGEMGRLLDAIEGNEDKAQELLRLPVEAGIFGGISESTEKRHAQAIRLMADNGVMFARLFGRDIGGAPKPEVLSGKKKPTTGADLLHSVQADMHLIGAGDAGATERQKAKKPAASVLDAIGLS